MKVSCGYTPTMSCLSDLLIQTKLIKPIIYIIMPNLESVGNKLKYGAQNLPISTKKCKPVGHAFAPWHAFLYVHEVILTLLVFCKRY